jgi:hypothetical protein
MHRLSGANLDFITVAIKVAATPATAPHSDDYRPVPEEYLVGQ